MTANKESGFTLIELAVVLVVVGLVMAGAMAMMKPYVEGTRINATRQKLNNISDALASFTQTYGRLPCPAAANPGAEGFGNPINSDGSDGVLEDCGGTANDYVGIIPFRALGLTEDNARDGYGNLITYAVSRTMAETKKVNDTTTNKVHQVCRTPNWIDTSGPAKNINFQKAALCCPRDTGAGDDLVILDERTGGDPVYSGVHSTTNAHYNSSASPYTPSPATDNFDTHVIAFVLVSHGENGDRAYIANSAARNLVTADPGAQESENHNDDLTFVDRPLSKVRDTNYFDDIVKWETNDQLISHFGNDSCGNPR